MMHVRRKVCFRHNRGFWCCSGFLTFWNFWDTLGRSAAGQVYDEEYGKGLENKIGPDTGDAPLFEWVLLIEFVYWPGVVRPVPMAPCNTLIR